MVLFVRVSRDVSRGLGEAILIFSLDARFDAGFDEVEEKE